MNDTPENQMHQNDQDSKEHAFKEHAFDAAMRQRYAEATTQVSARTQAQLHQRRRQALSTPRRAASPLRRYGLAGATACAALFAAVLGLQWQQENRVQPTLAAPSAPISADADDDDGGLYDQNPDFYLWLASQDAQSLAME
ncbi:hypothetical protein [Luteimonas panaciterrae]|uniref:hypothetical protein n=1 Tax=Luteimonas panaciterrae TaxID=363885 RepID=UPI001CFB4A59|nr:hypothetical protein [Luteimonas panaciterrae]